MRKMTKTAAVLAAMSAMTVASASMAFAATEVKNLTATQTPAEAEAVAEGSGTWSGNDATGWKFKTSEGKQLKDTWAQIDGIWYYFDGEKMAQEDFLYIDNKGYYFDQNGTLATGWQKIRSNTDAYDKLEISEQLTAKQLGNYVGTNYAYDYHDYVWCYFNEDGSAKENEWFKSPSSGLWYYFDNHVMVMDIMNYVIDPDNNDDADSYSFELYGFDKDGAMLTGWNYLDRKNDSWNDPTYSAGGKTYYYYDMDGTMQKAGWRKIDNTWYLFANTTTDKYGKVVIDQNEITGATSQAYGYPLVVNSYITSDKNSSKTEYFYVNKDGKMQTGVTTFDDKTWQVNLYKKNVDNGDDTVVEVNYETGKQLAKGIEAYFGTKGAADPDKAIDGKYYIGKDNVAAQVVNVKNSAINARYSATVADYKDAVTVAVTGNTAIKLTDAAAITAFTPDVEAQLVKSAFIGVNNDTLYLADKDGKFVTNKAVLICDEAGIEIADPDNETKSTKYDNAYILFGADGKARTDYTGKKRSFTVGGVTYWATGIEATIGEANVTVFISNKEVYEKH